MDMLADPAKVMPLTPVTVSDKHLALLAIVTVNVVPELALKITSSVANGGPAPPAPPDEADQLVVVEAFQFPVPPTQ